MNLDNLHTPESILESTRQVMATAKSVRVDSAALAKTAQLVTERLASGTDDIETAFGTTGVLEHDVNLVFFETAVNFYFWAEEDASKWKVEKDGEWIGGWYGLAACFDSACKRNVPVYDATWMSRLTVETARELFAGNGQQIPLLEQRVNNLVEAADWLLESYGGQAYDFVQACNFSAPRIAETVVRDLASFRDGSWYEGDWVWFLKRAQILASDLAQLNAAYPDFKIEDCDKLTAFADYRLPQVLEHLGALSYAGQLKKDIQAGRILSAGSPAEVEIRAATITAVEELKILLPTKTSADIDLGLWLLSQDMRTTLPLHHRTPGYFY